MSVNLSPVFNDTQFKSDGTLAVGYKIYIYAEGSTTPLTTYTNSLGTVAQSNPIILNARGEVDNPIWITAGVGYKFVLKTDTDVTIKTVDNIRGVNDTSIAVDQWIPASTPSYINANQFSVSGDQTSSFQTNRRAKFNTSAGTVYGSISSSVFSTLTTVTVVLDSGVLDAGLSSVSLGLLTPNNPSTPLLSDSFPIVSGSVDKSKKLRNEIDTFTTNTTRVVTWPDKDMTPAGLDDLTTVVPTGTMHMLATTTIPSGYLQIPNAPTTLSRTTYAALFAALGGASNPWGVGNGSTTFNMPYLPTNYAFVQAVPTYGMGTSLAGQVIAHVHTETLSGGGGAQTGYTQVGSQSWSTGALGATHDTASTGGAANLAAGIGIVFIVKY